jgi:uncharacterized protein
LTLAPGAFRDKRDGMKDKDPDVAAQLDQESPCQSCGACCAYSANWPRFSTEDDEALARIPEQFVNAKLSGMRCEGERCSALSGEIGNKTACMVYAVRPEVCRTCMPGDPECTMARQRFGMAALI